MPRVNCPNCDKVLVVPDRLAGKAGLCPGCKSRVEIPPLKSKAKEEDDDIVDSFVEDEDEPPPVRRKPRSDQERISAKRDSRRGRDEDEDRPSKRSRSRDDDEDDRPSRRSREDDEDDYDRPRRDDPPRRRRRKRRASSSGEFSFTSPAVITGLSLGGVVLLLCGVAIIVPAIAMVPIVLGAILSGVGGIWFLIVAFQDDVMQGVLCWFVPCYSLYYLITHFEEEKYPFFTQLAGSLLMMVGFCAGGMGAGVQQGMR